MNVRFNVDLQEMTAKISPASLRALDELTPVARADILKDVMYDAINAYNDAVKALFPDRKTLKDRRD